MARPVVKARDFLPSSLLPSQNGGVCVTPAQPKENETYAIFLDLPCRCPRPWAGSHCEKDSDGCLGNPCVTQCTDVTAAEEAANATAPAFRCARCPVGYQGNGQTCEGELFSPFVLLEATASVFLQILMNV